jgi:hypothetical protein
VAVSGLKNKIMFKKLFAKKHPQPVDPLQELVEWEQQGRPSPPPHIVKQNTVRAYQERFGIDALVETGTYLGDMVDAMRGQFKKIYSIELSNRLHQKALERFKDDADIHLFQGDSADRLKEIVSALSSPALFWLDGHYSGGITAMGPKECPVREELAIIFASDLAHVILIDDARMFNGTHDYPDMQELTAIVQTTRNPYSIETSDDIIRVIPS